MPEFPLETGPRIHHAHWQLVPIDVDYIADTAGTMGRFGALMSAV
jgi:hypothetical protein